MFHFEMQLKTSVFVLLWLKVKISTVKINYELSTDILCIYFVSHISFFQFDYFYEIPYKLKTVHLKHGCMVCTIYFEPAWELNNNDLLTDLFRTI